MKQIIISLLLCPFIIMAMEQKKIALFDTSDERTTDTEESLCKNIKDSYRFGPLHKESDEPPISQDVIANIKNTHGWSNATNIFNIRNHVKYRTVLAQAARQERDDKLSNIAYHAAILHQDFYLIEDLLKNKLVDPDHCSHGGVLSIPLFAAESVPIIDLLATHGASFDIVNDNGNTILHHVCYGLNSLDDAFLACCLKYTKEELLNKQRKRDQQTPLHVLADNASCAKKAPEYQKKLTLLLAKKPNVHWVDKNGHTALDILTKNYSESIDLQSFPGGRTICTDEGLAIMSEMVKQLYDITYPESEKNSQLSKIQSNNQRTT